MIHAHSLWDHHTVIDLGCPNSELQKYCDFSHGENGRSSSQAKPDHVSIHISHQPAYHQSRRHARQKRSVNPPSRNCIIRRLLVTQGVWQLYVGLGSTDHCTLQVSHNFGFTVTVANDYTEELQLIRLPFILSNRLSRGLL